MDVLDGIPPQYELIASLTIGFIIAIVAAWRFLRDLNGAGGGDRPDQLEQLRIVGAALNDSQRLADLVEELRAIRGVLERAIERDRTAELVQAVTRLADGLAASRPSPARAPRRR